MPSLTFFVVSFDKFCQVSIFQIKDSLNWMPHTFKMAEYGKTFNGCVEQAKLIFPLNLYQLIIFWTFPPKVTS